MKTPRKPRFERRAYIDRGRAAALKLAGNGELVAAVQAMCDHLHAHPATKPNALVWQQLQPRLQARAEAGDATAVFRFLKGVS